MKTPQPEQTQEREEDPAPLAKSTTRRTRKPRAEPEPVENQVELAVPATVRRGRRATTAEPEESAITPLATTRRGRKPAVEPEGDTTKDEKAALAKKGRKVESEEVAETNASLPAPTKRATRKVATLLSENEAEEEPQSQPPMRRGRTPRAAAKGKSNNDESAGARRAMKAKAPDVDIVHDGDEDSLDSIEQEEAEPATAIPKSKERKKAAVTPVVREEAEDGNLEKLAPMRGTKAKAITQKMPAARTRGATKKTPATAPAAIQQGVNKENTPGSEESLGVGLEEQVKIKVRVSRTTRKAVSGTAATAATRSAKVKQEGMEDTIESEAPRARVVRATRARTRT